MKKVLIALLLAVAVPNAAHADYVIWPDTNGIIFPYVPNGASVGDCYGNCGAGCSGDVNP